MTRLIETESIKEWRIFELAYFVKDEHRRGEWREVGGVLLLPPAVPVLPVVRCARRSSAALLVAVADCRRAAVVGYSASRPPAMTPSLHQRS